MNLLSGRLPLIVVLALIFALALPAFSQTTTGIVTGRAQGMNWGSTFGDYGTYSDSRSRPLGRRS